MAGLFNVFGKTVAELEAWCGQQDLPAYRARQLAAWLYSRRVRAFADMTNLPGALRERWEQAARIGLPAIVDSRRSRDGSEKFRIGLDDGEAVETVVMPMRPAEGERAERITACISTQAGCALGCTFCATATLGLRRNLDAGEIAGQVALVQTHLAPRRLTNLVMMGMGEPLHNFGAVVKAIEVITGVPGMQLGPKRITVSTVGLVPEIRRLAETGLDVKLAISLNATTDEARSATMPVNRKYPLAELMSAARYYALRTGLRVTFEYVVLAGRNDLPEDARRLATLIHGIPCKINLIPYNPYAEFDYRRPSDSSLEAFRELLYPRCPAVTVRYSKGLDIGAACGQLVAESGASSGS